MPSPLPAVVVALPHGRGYPVHFAPLAELPRHLHAAGLRPERAYVVTDEHVGPLYEGALAAALEEAGWHVRVRRVPPGEPSKSLDVLGALYDDALAWGVTRRTLVVALGGGVVGDLAGFLAATLLRGLPLAHAPTSVIAQVDSAIGGKTGVNHAAGKNLIGAFHQPALVLADPATLATLPAREFASGLAEAVKHALLEGGALLDALERDVDAVLAREAAAVARLVREAAAVKAAVVSADEHELGQRAVLNLGHTFGHALERALGYGVVTHGEAVALGMRAALHLSASLAAGVRLPPTPPLPDPFARADALVARLPTPPLPGTLGDADVLAAMGTDKKRDASGLRFVVLDAPGAPRLASDVPPAFVEAAWCYARRAASETASETAGTGNVTVTE
ncbi:MAG: 3-dehydroquinate synthase [Rubricoccaceae bacterium]